MLHRLSRSIIIGVILLPLFITGCIEVQQEIVISRWNGGEFKIFFSVPAAVYKKVAANSAMSVYFDPEKGAALFKDPSIKITKYRVFDHEDRRFVQIEGTLKDAKKALASGKLGNFEVTKTVDKMTRIELKLENGKGDLSKLAKGMKFDLRLQVPGKIKLTSSKSSSKGAAFWRLDVDKDPGFLREMPRVFVQYE